MWRCLEVTPVKPTFWNQKRNPKGFFTKQKIGTFFWSVLDFWHFQSPLPTPKMLVFCFFWGVGLKDDVMLGGGFKYFLFSPLFREDSHFD